MRLLVLRPGAIGDTLLTFPVLQALRACYSDPHVTLVGNAAVLPLARAFGVAEDLCNYEDVQWSELFSTRGVRTPALVDIVRRTDRAICWLRDSDGLVERNLRALGIEDIVIAPGRPAPGGALHIVQYLAQTIALPIDFEAICRGEESGQAGRRPAAPLHERGGEGLESDQRPCAIHPGSSAPSKCWPAPCFAAVIEQVWRQGRPVLLLAGPADQERVDEVVRFLPAQDRWGRLKVLRNAPLMEVACKLQEC
ncbi:MAG: glycosyltransferase family 9 protein, partial [Ktedonobacteraceae bacterium]